MIRVLYDHKGLDAAYGGVSCYFNEVIAHLPDGVEPVLSMVRTENPFLQAPPFNIEATRMSLNDFRRVWLRGHSFHGAGQLFVTLGRILPKVFPCNYVANQQSFRRIVKKGNFDLYHLTKAHPVVDETAGIYGKKPIVVTVHDLIPDLAGDKKVMAARRRILARATRIIAVSKNTKADILRLYDVPEDKITVIYHGHNPISVAPDAARPKCLARLMGAPYLLFVGRREGYKNFAWMVRALSDLQKKRQMHLVCTGPKFTSREQSLFQAVNIQDKVHHVFLSDAEFPAVYKYAMAFVYPSLYEGFGMPILDAFAAGCPVVLSKCSCFPEIGGDAALYFNQDDSKALVRAIVRICDNSDLRQELVVKGKRRSSLFDWRDCASRHVDVYQRCIRGI